MGSLEYGTDPERVAAIAKQLGSVTERGVEVAVVVGAGNIYRGLQGAAAGMDRATADYMGMLATVLNALTLQDALEKDGSYTRVMSAIDVTEGRLRGSTYVLEFSTNMLANAPGQLLYFQTPNASPVVMTGGLISPSGMGRDPITGTVYIAEIFTGRIIRVNVPRWIPS